MDKTFRWKTNQYAMMRIASDPAMETWHLIHLLRLLIRTVVDGYYGQDSSQYSSQQYVFSGCEND
jgi:hypothetical protein